MGMFLRRGLVEKPVQDFTVVLSGDMLADKAYAEIEGVLYTQAGTHVFPEGTSITVFCRCGMFVSGINVSSSITLNGEIVQKATKSDETIQFTFPLSGETSINFVEKKFTIANNYSCNITTH